MTPLDLPSRPDPLDRPARDPLAARLAVVTGGFLVVAAVATLILLYLLKAVR
jgi:hypothetical protein